MARRATTHNRDCQYGNCNNTEMLMAHSFPLSFSGEVNRIYNFQSYNNNDVITLLNVILTVLLKGCLFLLLVDSKEKYRALV